MLSEECAFGELQNTVLKRETWDMAFKEYLLKTVQTTDQTETL